MYRIIKRFIVYFLTICLLFPVLCTDFRSYTDDYSDVVEAIAGRHWLVRDGKQIRQNNEKISARSAIGLKADGTVVTLVTELEPYNAEKQQYAFSFDGLLAAELRSVVSVQLYEKDTRFLAPCNSAQIPMATIRPAIF